MPKHPDCQFRQESLHAQKLQQAALQQNVVSEYTETLAQNGWMMMPTRSRLVGVFAAQDSVQRVPLFNLMGEGRLLEILFPGESRTDGHRVILQHLCSQFDHRASLFFTNHQRAEAEASFLGSKSAAMMIASLRALKAKNSYVFGKALWKGAESLSDTPHHLIVSRADLADQRRKKHLRVMLAVNPSHTLVLYVDATSTGGTLTLATEDLPEGVRKFVLCDTNNNIKTIGDQFLYGAIHLRTFDTVGLTALQSIGDEFLSYAVSLETFDTRGLTALKSIGDKFLSLAFALKTFDTRGLTALQSIGDKFLSLASALETFDTRGLRALKSIGDEFLSYAVSLETFDTRGLTALQSIGTLFLWHAESLETFDTVGLTALQSIGNSFLVNTSVKGIEGPRALLQLFGARTPAHVTWTFLD